MTQENWKDKYPIGSQWKTRGGWRAQILRYQKEENMLVWHSEQPYTPCDHNKNGTRTRIEGLGMTPYEKERKQEFDLIEPWTEPRKGEFWVNVYEGVNKYATKEGADNGALSHRLACVKVSWTEGEGLE